MYTKEYSVQLQQISNFDISINQKNFYEEFMELEFQSSIF